MFAIIKILINLKRLISSVLKDSNGKRLVVYSCFEFGGHSGAAKQSFLLAKTINLNSDRFYCFLLNFEHNVIDCDNYYRDGVHVISISRKKVYIFLSLFFVSKFCSIVHMHAFSLVMILAAAFSRKKIILKTTLIGDDDFKSLANSRFGWLKIFLTRFVNVNIALSKSAMDINSRYMKPSLIHCVPNGIEFNKVCNDGIEKSDVFCIVGIICKRKNTLLGIKYFIDHYFPHGAKLYIVGPGPGYEHLAEFDKDYYDNCVSAASNAMNSSVFFTGNLSKDELSDIYRQSLAMLLFSEAEGMPNVVLEGMVFNCVPILSEMNGVAKDIVDPGTDGFIIKDYSIAPSIEELRNISMSNVLRKKVVENMSIDSVSQRYIDIYRGVID